MVGCQVAFFLKRGNKLQGHSSSERGVNGGSAPSLAVLSPYKLYSNQYKDGDK